MAELIYFKSVEDEQQQVDISLDKWGDNYAVLVCVYGDNHETEWRVVAAFKNRSVAIEKAVDVARLSVVEVLRLPFAAFDAQLHY